MRSLVFGLVSLLLIGCGDNAAEPVADTHGIYDLQSINGDPMPYFLGTLTGVDTLEYTESTMTLNDDQTWVEVGVVTQFISGAIFQVDTVLDFGTWSRSNNTLQLVNPARNETLTGTLQDRTLTVPISIADSLFVYQYVKRE